MKSYVRLSGCLILLLTLATSAWAGCAQTRIHYVERNTGLPATLNWYCDNKGYHLTMTIPAIFTTIEYRSEGLLEPSYGLRPQSFQEFRNGQLHQQAVFDWTQKQLHYNNGKNTTPLLDNAHDVLSLPLQLTLRPIESALEQSKEPIQLTNGRKAYQTQLTAQRDDLTIESHPYDTIHFQANNPDTSISIWTDGNIPLRITYTKTDNLSLDLQAVKVEKNGATIWPEHRIKQD